MTNYDVAQKVVSYFDKKTKTLLSKELLTILLTVSDTALESVTIQQYLHEEQNEYRALCYIYQRWQEQFLSILNHDQQMNRTNMKIAGVKVPLSLNVAQEGLSLFREIDALNVFEASNPALFQSL